MFYFYSNAKVRKKIHITFTFIAIIRTAATEKCSRDTRPISLLEISLKKQQSISRSKPTNRCINSQFLKCLKKILHCNIRMITFVTRNKKLMMDKSEPTLSHNALTAEINHCVDIMRKGGIILYPTDTVWGIGCDATNSEAVKKIYQLKQRSDSKSMIILVNNTAMLERFVDEVPDIAWELLDAVVDPTTIVFDHGIGLAPELLAEDGSIGVRMTQEAFSSALCRALRKPVVSTSANISGKPTARFYHEISEEILNGVDYVANYRREDDTPHKPSSVIKLSSSGEVKILRP